MSDYLQAEDVQSFEECTPGLGDLLGWFSTVRPLKEKHRSIELVGNKVWLCVKVFLPRGWYWTREKALITVTPNEKCPCGSGKKYKKCCHHEQQITV